MENIFLNWYKSFIKEYSLTNYLINSKDDNLIVLQLREKNKADLDICYWLKEQRILVILEGKEIIDETVDKKSIDNLKLFLHNLLSYEIKIEKKISKSGRVLSEVYSYYGSDINDNLKEYSERFNYSFLNFISRKYSITLSKFDSWI